MSDGPAALGRPRLHLRQTDSTNARARARRGRRAARNPGHGRRADRRARPPGPDLERAGRTGAAVLADRSRPAAPAAARRRGRRGRGRRAARRSMAQRRADRRRKVAGILVEGRPQEHWSVLGMGLNVALTPDFPPELRGRAATLGLQPAAIEPTLRALLARLATGWRPRPRRCWPPSASATPSAVSRGQLGRRARASRTGSTMTAGSGSSPATGRPRWPRARSTSSPRRRAPV